MQSILRIYLPLCLWLLSDSAVSQRFPWPRVHPVLLRLPVTLASASGFLKEHIPPWPPSPRTLDFCPPTTHLTGLSTPLPLFLVCDTKILTNWSWGSSPSFPIALKEDHQMHHQITKYYCVNKHFINKNCPSLHCEHVLSIMVSHFHFIS